MKMFVMIIMEGLFKCVNVLRDVVELKFGVCYYDMLEWRGSKLISIRIDRFGFLFD